jgi:hypothetical protein
VSDQNESTNEPSSEPNIPSARALQLHDEYRRKIWEDKASGTENFDKYLISFSTGALALSLSFIKDIVPLKDAVWIPLLIASWVAFVLAALVTLISFRLSHSALERMFYVINDYYLNGRSDAFDKHMDDPRTKAMELCAWGGLILFVVGLACTMIFASGNVLGASGTAGKNSPSPDNSIHIERMDVCCNSQTMKPVTHSAKKGDDFGKGVKPTPMVPVPPKPPASPASCPAPEKG